MSLVRISDTWRTTTFRLVTLYGGMFAIGVVSLLALIYFDTANYIDNQTAQILKAELRSYLATPPNQLVQSFKNDMERDSRHIEIYGLFSPTRQLIAGNAEKFPSKFLIDNQPHYISSQTSSFFGFTQNSIWGMATELPDKNILFLGRKQIQLDEIRHVILKALVGACVIIIIGTFIGIKFSIYPIRRIREIDEISQKIISGDISLRLPRAGRDDELDMLATIVNRMLDEIAQRMRDIKGSTDSIAHDLRTPLTHLRAMLNRLMHSSSISMDREAVEKAIDEVDSLLFRFRAILRISEISGSIRRAMFDSVDLKEILENIQDMYAPLAEEKKINLQLNTPESMLLIIGDKALLFEALLNLVDNAIKFSAAGGNIKICLISEKQGAKIVIENDGLNIAADEMNMIFQPFYRGKNSRHIAGGHGVGLSIVSSIMNLHGFQLNLSSQNLVTTAVICCWQ